MLGKRKRVNALVAQPKYKKAKKIYTKPRFGLLKSKFTTAKAPNARTCLIYSENQVNIDAGSGTTAVYVFTANGLYDPNVTGVGHQPVGFDQYMALYNEYIVLGSTIEVYFQNTDTTYAQYVGISLLDQSTTNVDDRVYMENGQTTWTTLGVRNSGNDIKKLTFKADISKFSTQSIFNEDGFCGSANANPADTHFFHIWAVCTDAAGNPSAVQAKVVIKYDVLFRDSSLTSLS